MLLVKSTQKKIISLYCLESQKIISQYIEPLPHHHLHIAFLIIVNNFTIFIIVVLITISSGKFVRDMSHSVEVGVLRLTPKSRPAYLILPHLLVFAPFAPPPAIPHLCDFNI